MDLVTLNIAYFIYTQGDNSRICIFSFYLATRYKPINQMCALQYYMCCTEKFFILKNGVAYLELLALLPKK